MPIPYNAPSRLRRRRDSALERVQKDIRGYEKSGKSEDKLEKAKAHEANLKANLVGGR